MKPLNLRANGGKHQKLLLGNNAPGKCLHIHMQHLFSPSPAIQKKFAESAFFHTKTKNLSWNHWIYEPMWENTKNYYWATMRLASACTPTCKISSALAPLSRRNSLSQHFVIQNSKTCHETVEFTSQSGKTPKTTPEQQCSWQVPSRPHATFIQPSTATLKKFAESAFLHKKIKNLCHETGEFSSQWGQNTKNYLWSTMPLASAFAPACNISPALAPLSRNNSTSQHFFRQKSNTCHETVEFTSQTGQNTKIYSWATMPLASAFTPTCNISSAVAPLSRKHSLSHHIFI